MTEEDSFAPVNGYLDDSVRQGVTNTHSPSTRLFYMLITRWGQPPRSPAAAEGGFIEASAVDPGVAEISPFLCHPHPPITGRLVFLGEKPWT